jgi:hypothetical protein
MASLDTVALVSFAVASGGATVLVRDSIDGRAARDLFLRTLDWTPPNRKAVWRRWLRPCWGARLRAGDCVVVLDADEISKTLDVRGTLGGLPFMAEMLGHCGHVFTVDRRIDKINDWIAGNDIRRMRNVVTLVGQRCDGAGHGGCQAACHLLWHERWLRRVSDSGARSDAIPSINASAGQVCRGELETLLARSSMTHVGSSRRFICQITELPRISARMSRWDIRQDLRPLLNGNLPLAGFCLALLTRLFNAVQAFRGGAQYPVPAPQLSAGPTPVATLDLQPGELVMVRSKEEIGLTLFKNHNRGMWFGAETSRHCRRRYRVGSRVDRIIDERSGELRNFRIPAVTLNDVTASGEFLRFCPQKEYVFWREIWLERVPFPSAES